MATFTGRTVGAGQEPILADRDYLSVNMLTADDTSFGLDRVYASDLPTAGGFNVAALPTLIHDLEGDRVTSINSPLYQIPHFVKDTVLIDSTYLNIGMVSEELSLSFNIWSPYSTKKEVASFGFLDTTAGLSLSGISVGTIFNPYEEKTVDLTVASEGIPVIDTYFYISFTGDSTLFYLQLKGARIGQFYVMEPNWQDGIKVEHRFLTSVFSSQDMSETRKVLRNRPARSLTATVPFYTKHDASRMWALLRDCSKQTTMHPFYPDKSAMTASSTSTRVYCPTEYRRFEAGKYVFLVRDKSYPYSKYFEIVRIHEVFADGFSTDDAILNSYTTGDAVYPALACLASFEIAQELMTDNKATVEMTLEEVYDTSTLDNENGMYTPVLRASYPTLDVDLTFSEPSVKIVCAGGVEDSGRGFVQHVKGVPYIEQTATAFCRTKEECWKTIGFFNHLRGRGKPFWVRSEIDWIAVASSSGSSSIIITNPVYLKDMDYLKYLWITDSTGAFDVVRVVSSSLTVDGIQLLLAASSLVDIATVRQAHPVRLSEDVITEEYLTDSVMVATFTVQELQGI